MTPQATLIELLARVGAAQDATVLVNEEELSQWPIAAVAAMKAQKLIAKAGPAASAVCPGCEYQCVMSVYTPPTTTGGAASFIVCDKRNDINRVPVPINRLVQWRCSANAVCGFIATCLGVRRSDRAEVSASRWRIGMITGGKRSQMLSLYADGELVLSAGSNKVPLVEFIAYDEDAYSLDNSMIRQLVDSEPPEEDAHTTATENPCGVFLAMENLDATELAIAFVGDQSETGLGANNMLEISARGETRRVALAALDLVDRRRGTANSKCGVLLGIVRKKKLGNTGANAATMKRLRQVFRKHLGIRGDPFEPNRKGAGWLPRFKIVDKRGAGDERARRQAERRTDSYEKLNERGDRFANGNRTDSLLDADNDEADDWLKTNDPDEPA